MEKAPEIAVFIDGDNIPAKQARNIRTKTEQIAKAGGMKIAEIKVFVSISSPHLESWNGEGAAKGMEVIPQPTYNDHKSVTDQALTIGAMENLLSERRADIFIIATNDSDFIKLGHRIQQEGSSVSFAGLRAIMPQSLRRAGDMFMLLDDAAEPVAEGMAPEELMASPPVASRKSTAKISPGGKKLEKMLFKYFPDSRWRSLSEIGKNIKTDVEGFNVKQYGYAKLKDFFDESGSFEVEVRKSPTGKVNVIYVRKKPDEEDARPAINPNISSSLRDYYEDDEDDDDIILAAKETTSFDLTNEIMGYNENTKENMK